MSIVEAQRLDTRQLGEWEERSQMSKLVGRCTRAARGQGI